MAWMCVDKRWMALVGIVVLGSSSHLMAANVDYAASNDSSTTATGSLLAVAVDSTVTTSGSSASTLNGSAGGPASLTGGSTTNVAPAQGLPGDGKPDVIYDPLTGDIKISADGRNLVNTFSFLSSHAIFTGSAPNFPGTSAASTQDFDDEITRSGFSPPFDATTVWDLGNVAQTGKDFNFLASDLQLAGNTQPGSNQPGFFNYDLIVAGSVPEPASIGLLGLGAVGLLARRRRVARKA